MNNKDDMGYHPYTQTTKNPSCNPAQMCREFAAEKVASTYLTPGSAPWYYAHGLTPPGEETENGRKDSDEG